jgi:hypothetical protein
VRRLLIQGEATLDDEVSADLRSWRRVALEPEVVPRDMRPEGATAAQGFGRDRGPPIPLLSITVAALLVAGIIGFGFWWGGSGSPGEPDCRRPASPGVDWRNCGLSGLRAAGAELEGARLQNADLAGATLAGAGLTSAALDYANLRGADLGYAVLRSASLRGADLRGADLTNADLSDADLRFADLSDTILAGAVLQGTRLDRAIWIDGSVCGRQSVGRCTPAGRTAP